MKVEVINDGPRGVQDYLVELVYRQCIFGRCPWKDAVRWNTTVENIVIDSLLSNIRQE